MWADVFIVFYRGRQMRRGEKEEEEGREGEGGGRGREREGRGGLYQYNFIVAYIIITIRYQTYHSSIVYTNYLETKH